jgi:ketosteroid isomerase-like protein
MGCNNPNTTAVVEEPAPLNHITTLMEEQELSWNEGDLEGFMAAYWKSDSLVFIGSKGLQYGWSTTLHNYRKTYINKALMGELKFENIEIQPLGNHSAWVAGKWHLYRSADTLSGSYLLVWKYMNGQWKIIADHSS